MSESKDGGFRKGNKKRKIREFKIGNRLGKIRNNFQDARADPSLTSKRVREPDYICKWCRRGKRYNWFGICKCLKCSKHFDSCPPFCRRRVYKNMFKLCKKTRRPNFLDYFGNYAKRSLSLNKL